MVKDVGTCLKISWKQNMSTDLAFVKSKWSDVQVLAATGCIGCLGCFTRLKTREPLDLVKVRRVNKVDAEERA